jgi:hypothetical protein
MLSSISDQRHHVTAWWHAQDTTGADVDLSEYKGKVVLVTNVASALLSCQCLPPAGLSLAVSDNAMFPQNVAH